MYPIIMPYINRSNKYEFYVSKVSLVVFLYYLLTHSPFLFSSCLPPQYYPQFDEITQDLSVSQLSQSQGADYMEEVAWQSHQPYTTKAISTTLAIIYVMCAHNLCTFCVHGSNKITTVTKIVLSQGFYCALFFVFFYYWFSIQVTVKDLMGDMLRPQWHLKSIWNRNAGSLL